LPQIAQRGLLGILCRWLPLGSRGILLPATSASSSILLPAASASSGILLPAASASRKRTINRRIATMKSARQRITIWTTSKQATRIAIASVMLGICMSATAQAQVRPVSHTGQSHLFDDIVKGLVDQNLNFNSSRPLDQNRNPVAGPELQQAQQAITRFANDAGLLISALRIEERYSPNVRGLIGDALRVKADADVLVQRAAYMTTIRQFTDEYANIDQQWRVLSNQLKQIPNVGSRVVQEVNRVNQSAEAIARNSKLDPQMQRDELMQSFHALAADLKYLSDDIGTDLWSHPNRDTLAQQVFDLQNRTNQLVSAVQYNYGYQYVKGSYEQFFEKWMVTKRSLREIDNQNLQRHIDHVTQATERLHELLWLPPFVDGGDILYMANTLKTNLDSICDGISLTKLMALPNSDKIFAAAREFYSMCDQFRSTVSSAQEFDEVQWDFREVDVAWNDLRNLIVNLKDQSTMQNIAQIDNSIMDLRDALGQQSTVDTHEIMEVVSTIDNMTDLLYYDLNRYVGQSNRYPASFRSQAVNSAMNLHRTAHTLYESVAQKHSASTIRQQSQALVSQWNDLQQYLAKIPADERAHIARTSGQIGPALAKLQVMYY
jgi:hypothetical protein